MADSLAPSMNGSAAAAPNTHRQAELSERNHTIRELFTEHHTTLLRLLTAKLHSENDAKEVAQEAYLKLLEMPEPGAICCPRAYLFRVATNLATDRLRNQQVRRNAERAHTYTMEDLLAAPQPDRILTGSEQLAIVRTAMLELPEKCRIACALYLFAEQSVGEVAKAMNLSARMVRYYVARGLSHCRHALDVEPRGSDGAADS